MRKVAVLWLPRTPPDVDVDPVVRARSLAIIESHLATLGAALRPTWRARLRFLWWDVRHNIDERSSK